MDKESGLALAIITSYMSMTGHWLPGIHFFPRKVTFQGTLGLVLAHKLSWYFPY